MKTQNHWHTAIVIDSLKPGGSERVASVMANFWVRKARPVTLITLKNKDSFYSLDERVQFKALDISDKSNHYAKGIMHTCKRIKILVQYFKQTKPDVVISFFNDINVLCILAGRVTGIPVIITERSHPGKKQIPLRWRVASKIFYNLAQKLVVQTTGAEAFFKHYRVPTAVIPNPLPKQMPLDSSLKDNVILGAGRLIPLKGFNLLIRAFAHSGLYPGWKLVILGDGPEKKKLESLIEKLGLTKHVSLPGMIKDVEKYYQMASIFVLSSKYEGFPNALAEAMGAGLACISFDCAFGPAEMILHNQNGMLINTGDVESLTNALVELANDKAKRTRLGNNARKIHERYAADRIMEQWDQVLQEVT